MPNLTVSLTENEKILIGNELEKLFSFQDRPFSKDKRAHLVTEIASYGYPFGSIMLGIRAMFSEELKRITLADILSSCSEKISHEDEHQDNRESCDNCLGCGCVIMSDENKYHFSLACTCSNGNSFIQRHFARWNGEKTQYRGKRLLTKVHG